MEFEEPRAAACEVELLAHAHQTPSTTFVVSHFRPTPPVLLAASAFVFNRQIFGADKQVPGRRRRHLKNVRPCVLQSGKGRIVPSIRSA